MSILMGIAIVGALVAIGCGFAIWALARRLDRAHQDDIALLAQSPTPSATGAARRALAGWWLPRDLRSPPNLARAHDEGNA